MGISSRINNTRRKTRRNNKKQRQSQKTKQKKYTQRRGGRPMPMLSGAMNWIRGSKPKTKAALNYIPALSTAGKVLASPNTMYKEWKNKGVRTERYTFKCVVCDTPITEPPKFKTALLGSESGIERANIVRNVANAVINTNKVTYYYNCPVCFHMYSLFSAQNAGQGEYKCTIEIIGSIVMAKKDNSDPCYSEATIRNVENIQTTRMLDKFSSLTENEEVYCRIGNTWYIGEITAKTDSNATVKYEAVNGEEKTTTINDVRNLYKHETETISDQLNKNIKLLFSGDTNPTEIPVNLIKDSYKFLKLVVMDTHNNL